MFRVSPSRPLVTCVSSSWNTSFWPTCAVLPTGSVTSVIRVRALWTSSDLIFHPHREPLLSARIHTTVTTHLMLVVSTPVSYLGGVGTNLDLGRGCSEVFHDFPLSLRASPKITPRPLTSKSFPINYLLIVLLFETVYSGLLIVTLKWATNKYIIYSSASAWKVTELGSL